MKPLVTLTICLTSLCLSAKDIYSAIAEVESHSNDNAVNIRENAVGRYQIRPIYVRDVNRISGRSYALADRTDPVKALEMVKIYTGHYCSIYSKRTGKPISAEMIARCHNGGAVRGITKKSTEKYWKKVKRVLDK